MTECRGEAACVADAAFRISASANTRGGTGTAFGLEKLFMQFNKLPLAVAASLLASAPFAHANDELTAELAPVVVSATRFATLTAATRRGCDCASKFSANFNWLDE